MRKIDISRRNFLKGTAVTTVVAVAALAGKEISDSQHPEASIGDLEIENKPAQVSCLDYLNAIKKQQNS